MKYTIEKGAESLEIKMAFTKEEWSDAIDKAYKKNSGKFKVPGFRSGKVPRKVIENTYGEHIFHEDGVSEAFLPAYNTVLAENPNVEPTDYPTIDFKYLDEGIEITATVDVLPEFKLGKYTGLEIKRMDVKIDEKNVDEYLEKLRASRARQVEAKPGHKIANGDIAIIDFVGSVDGIEFPGGKGENYELEIGSNSFIDTFETQLVGSKVDDVINVNVTFPKQYHATDLAGKPALFVVTVKKIMQKELPELNDDFAKDLSEFATMKEFRADAKARIEKQAEAEVKQENEQRLVNKIVEQTKIELPQKMIERQLDHMMYMMESRLGQQGATLEMYAQYTGTTVDAMREAQRKEAENVIKTRLVIDEIVKKESLAVTEEEIDAEIDKLVEATGGKKSGFNTKDRRNYIKNDMMYSKVLKFLEEKNKFV
ncbi:MAG: trigger factor [Firmicutes bacterium]|nr:trigger factor [Bacillota bacterium]